MPFIVNPLHDLQCSGLDYIQPLASRKEMAIYGWLFILSCLEAKKVKSDITTLIWVLDFLLLILISSRNESAKGFSCLQIPPPSFNCRR